jgi:hypothetical protein
VSEREQVTRDLLKPSFWLAVVVVLAGLGFQATRAVPLGVKPPDWTLQCSDGNIARIVPLADGADGVRIEIDRPVFKQPWDLAVGRHVAVQAGKTYELTFQGRSGEPRRVTLNLREFHPPWENLGFYQDLDLEPQWQSFQFRFVAKRGSNHAMLDFQLGTSAVSAEFKNVALSPVIDPEPGTRPEPSAEGEGSP